MAQGGSRFEKGSEETRARMAKVREARAARSESPVGTPFVNPRAAVEVNEFTGQAQGGFPQMQFVGIDVIGPRPFWPGDPIPTK